MNHNTDRNIVTRFAPSPTGFIHIGNIRTALYAWLWARHENGTFILRIEDTDKSREQIGSIAHIQDALRWLGLDWDIGPDKPGAFTSCLQSERLPLYKEWAEKLVSAGLAYPDPYTNDEVAAFRQAAVTQNKPFLYRNHRPEQFATWDGTQPLRFRVPEIKRHTWEDAVRGTLSAGEEMLDDFIILKADGYPTYNFAHIIDDYLMGVTHVMRGEEFISSTPKYLSLYDALEIDRPTFVTLPPIMGPDGKKKLSKRDGSKDFLEYAKDGYLPEAMRNFLALIGWNPGGDDEIFTTDELIQKFSLQKIQRSGGAFNQDKLDWMNKMYLEKLTDAEKVDYLNTVLEPAHKSDDQFSTDRLEKIMPIIFERIQNKKQLQEADREGEYDWAFKAPTFDPQLLKWKDDETVSAVIPRLEKCVALLSSGDFSSPAAIKSAVWDYAEAVGRGQVLWPLRVALSGRERSPDPFSMAFVLGKNETIKRIEESCDKIDR